MKQTKTDSLRRICALILTLAVVCSLAGCSRHRRTTKEIEKTVLGIDVSGRYQGTIDWQQLGQSGIGFVIVRLGYRGSTTGVINEDSNARYNLQEGSKAGIPMGAYFYSTAITVEEAKEEARWAAELIAKYPITYPVAYDCEGYREPDNRHHHLTNKERTDIALAFLETIESYGYEGMFYGSKNEIDLFWDIARIEKDYKVWVAQYPSLPYPNTPVSSYEGQHQMWQYSAEGRVLGIEHPVDLNVAYFGYDGIEPPVDSEPAEEVEPDIEAMMAFEEVSEQVTAKDKTNLRDRPSQDEDSIVLDTLLHGEIAHRVAISGSGWSKLEFEGNIYYAHSNYLTSDLTSEDLKPEAEGELSAEEDPDGDGIVTQFTPTATLVTAKEKTNLRSIPSYTREDSEIMFELLNGQVAKCIGVSENGWSKLEYQGKICYAISSYLTEPEIEQVSDEDVGMSFQEINDIVTPTKKEVNLRTRPTTDNRYSEVVVKLPSGETVARTGINRDTHWSRVVYYGQVLYCSSDLIKEVVN